MGSRKNRLLVRDLKAIEKGRDRASGEEGKGRTKLKACEGRDNRLSLRHLGLRLSSSASRRIFPHLPVSPNNRNLETKPQCDCGF